MSQEKLYSIILAPHVSEKAVRQQILSQYAFKVATRATKPEIKKAVEAMFKVAVKSVCICNVKGKLRRTGRVLGRRKDWKKAYVTLVAGNTINLEGLK